MKICCSIGSAGAERLRNAGETAFSSVAGLFLAALILCLLPLPSRAEDAPKTQEAATFIGSETCAECHAGETKLARLASCARHAESGYALGPRPLRRRFLRKGRGEERLHGQGRPLFRPHVRCRRQAGGFRDQIRLRRSIRCSNISSSFRADGCRRSASPGTRGPQSKAASAGIDLYPDRKLSPGDPLHWTGVDQNWNFQCAWCHTTNLQKNYDAASNGFSTRWSELGVGCEACHGPASTHLAWARGMRRNAPQRRKGLRASFDEQRGARWPMNDKGQASRSAR